MKILVYSSAAAFGGHELMSLKGLRALLTARHELELWVYIHNRPMIERVGALVEEYPGQITTYFHQNSAKSLQILRSWLQIHHIVRLTRQFRQSAASRILVLQGDIEQGSEAVIAGWLSRKPVVSYIPMIMSGKERGIRLAYFREIISRPLYHMASRLVVISDYFRERALAYGVTNIRVVFNTIDENFFSMPSMRQDVRASLGVSPAEFLTGYVGRIAYQQKGIDRLIKLIDEHRQFFSANRILIVGDGPDRLRLLDDLAQRGIDNCVIYRPWVDTERVGLFDSIDVFLCLSRFEGVPLTILEAISRNIPVLSLGLAPLLNVLPVQFISDAVDTGLIFSALERASLAIRSNQGAVYPIEFVSKMDRRAFDSSFVAAVVE
jgi:glycosyltransferase involved in cell wall biosynthesis